MIKLRRILEVVQFVIVCILLGKGAAAGAVNHDYERGTFYLVIAIGMMSLDFFLERKTGGYVAPTREKSHRGYYGETETSRSDKGV
jgi:hypothetical protein